MTDLDKKTILFIEDDFLFIKNFSKKLKAEFNLKFAKDANEALNILEKNEVDISLVDIDLGYDTDLVSALERMG
jgi:ActR/RegA family two-component response regulator